MKQKISLLLAFLAVWTMTACGNTEPRETAKTPAADTSAVTDTETEAETEPSIVELLGEKDMNGATYTMLDGSNGIQINIPGEELTGEAVNDAMIHRDNFLEEEYNVVIDYIGMKTGEALSAMQKSVKAGDDAFNLVVATIFDFANQVNGHYLYNMMELPYVEAAQPWYSPLMADSLSLDGHMYFTASDICPSVYQSSCCMFLNLKLYDDFGSTRIFTPPSSTANGRSISSSRCRRISTATSTATTNGRRRRISSASDCSPQAKRRPRF